MKEGGAQGNMKEGGLGNHRVKWVKDDEVQTTHLHLSSHSPLLRSLKHKAPKVSLRSPVKVTSHYTHHACRRKRAAPPSRGHEGHRHSYHHSWEVPCSLEVH